MNQIENTKKTFPEDKAIPSTDLLSVDQPKKLEDDKFTLDQQLKYPLLKPIIFTNAPCDDYIYSGCWNLNK